jgi:predicted Zn-dependent peptidase
VSKSAVFDHQNSGVYKKTTLDNGVRIITEEIPFFQSVAVGIWAHSGSRFEPPAVNGICHFIEHMLFKGTEKRSAFTIAKEIDAVGGALNAFTSKELTSYHCRVLDEHLDLAMDLLSDIYLNASFPEEEIDREKQVVCGEICQVEDSAEDLVHEILGIRFWQDDPLGQPILGTIPTVEKFDRQTIVDFKRDYYVSEETLICAAGRVDHEAFVNLVAKQMEALPGSRRRPVTTPVKVDSAAHIVNRDLEQVHVCIGMESPSAVDDRRHASYVLNTILGGGMSSRLFQEVREKRGLAYNVYSFLSCFTDTGILGIYAGCDPERIEELMSVMGKETLNFAKTVTEEELQLAKSQIKGNIILAMESTDSRMNRLAKSEFYFGRHVIVDEILKSLDKVSLKDLVEISEQLLVPGKYTIVALGSVDEKLDLFGLFQG